jgi:hypothetical protein
MTPIREIYLLVDVYYIFLGTKIYKSLYRQAFLKTFTPKFPLNQFRVCQLDLPIACLILI